MFQQERSRDWNIGLAEDLKDPEFAREFLLAAMEENLPLPVTMSKVKQAHQEFA
ncbi:hypothetical protein [Acaryochloris thomasi]|uniref:hypothetical protein n=1 Tax=Acaryochloris thomasi TaxID=2929456 RepID=UPI0013149063|nr:hypothetical protein [Acaryochloris thomasi]